jgi:hypothetical protein
MPAQTIPNAMQANTMITDTGLSSEAEKRRKNPPTATDTDTA